MEKLIKLVSNSHVTVKQDDNGDEVLEIVGYASTGSKDRHGDIILPEAWKKGTSEYERNPIILAYHNHDTPAGKTTGLEINKKGLKITGQISKAAGNVYTLVKEGILSTFSVGFMVKDADYDEKTNIFVIKEAELLEISVVAVPANPDATFSIAKCFEYANHIFRTSLIVSQLKPLRDK